jgi:hypothetical protein
VARRPPLVIGDASDPHVEAVVAEIRTRGVESIVLDVASLSEWRWRLQADTFDLLLGDAWVRPHRAWLRRLAPAGHHHGVELGGRRAAEASARLALIASLTEAGVQWLSDYWSVVRAENKLIQYAIAGRIGLPVPSTIVASNVAAVGDEIADPFVVKPLGPGDYFTDGQAFAVHSRSTDRGDEALAGLHLAPFIIQQRVEARCHLRVVTVQDQSWAAALDASDLPLDWRRDHSAHSSWTKHKAPEIEAAAVRLARALNLGFTSQDWIIDQDEQWWFVDGNPGGQWLFLPSEIGVAVTDALARWLVEET